MRTLIIAGLGMAAALGATSAGAQHVLSNGQVWANGHIMPPTPIQPAPPMQMQQMPQQQYHPMPQPQYQPQQYHPQPYHQMPMPPQGMQHQPRWGGTSGGHWHGGMNAPGGWGAYHAPSRGWTLPRYWIAPSFYIGDYGTYGLSTPPQGYSWTRYYDDAVLMDQRGRVWDSVGGIDWDTYDSAYGDDGAPGGYGTSYQAQQGYAGPPRGYAPPPLQDGYSSSYSSSASGGGAGGYASGGYWYPPATTTTVTIQSAPVVTTTTTEYVETTRYVPARRVYHARRKWVPRRTCNCGCGCR